MIPEVAEKWRQIIQLSEQIAPLSRKIKRTIAEAVDLQGLQRRRKELLDTLPAIHLSYTNPNR